MIQQIQYEQTRTSKHGGTNKNGQEAFRINEMNTKNKSQLLTNLLNLKLTYFDIKQNKVFCHAYFYSILNLLST